MWCFQENAYAQPQTVLHKKTLYDTCPRHAQSYITNQKDVLKFSLTSYPELIKSEGIQMKLAEELKLNVLKHRKKIL